MSIRVVEFDESSRSALAAFNGRLAAGGSEVRFPAPGDSHAAPPTYHMGLLQKQFLALDDERQVRGAYALKFQDFWLCGSITTVADFRLPVSEAIVDPAYTHVALALLLDAPKRQSMLYGLGMGGFQEPVARLLKAAGWQLFSVPFYFQVIRPFPFFRNIVHLRTSAVRRLACDFLAYSGLGWLSVEVVRVLHPRRVAFKESIQAEVVEEFGRWADDIWEAAKAHYSFCSLRDASTLGKMYPRGVPNCVRLKISARGRPIGWSVLMNTALANHAHFGNMRLGSIVDCFAVPDAAARVLDQSREYLVRQGADLIVSNQSHRVWRRAFSLCGFVSGPSNFLFAASRKLTEAMEKGGVSVDDVHVNRGDGDGPIHL